MACFNIFNIFNILHRVCSMQHESPTSLTYPGSCKSCFSRKPVFGRKLLLIFPIIYQIAHLHNWPTCPLIFADSCPGCQNYPVLTGLAGKMSNFLSLLIYFTQLSWMPELSSFNWFGRKKEQFSQFVHIFHRDQTCLATSTSPTLKLLTNLYLLYLI